nr:hypothetical protein [Tanacetum cinerariifolium]
MDVSMDSTNKDYISSVLESVKDNSLTSKISNIDGKILPRRYTTYQEPLKDIGKPLMLDSYTSNMCLNSWGRSAYARVLIEIVADIELMKSLIIAIPITTKNSFSALSEETDTNLKDNECVNADGQTPVESQFFNDSDEDVDEYITMEESSKAVSNNQEASTLVEVSPHD